MLGKYLALWLLGQVFTRAPALRHYISDLTGLVFLTIGGGILVGALVLGFFYGEYLALTDIAGMTHACAFAVVWLSGAVLFAGAAVLVYHRIRRLLKMTRALRRAASPVAAVLDPVIEAFMSGFEGESRPADLKRPETRRPHAPPRPEPFRRRA